METNPSDTRTLFKRVGFWLGIVFFLAMVASPAPDMIPEKAWLTAAVAGLMAIWWVTEALHIAATALIPLVLFPLLQIASIQKAAAPFANPIIFLFLGGFILAKAIEQCGLHRRFALWVLTLSGGRPPQIVAGFMVATALISMWVSNTATAVMMYPIALSVIELTKEKETGKNFDTALLLGVAYAANIGGLGTLIGTPPNALLAGFLAESYGYTIGFSQWMLLGLPLVAIALPLSWLILTRWHFSLTKAPLTSSKIAFRQETMELGCMSARERWVAAVVGLTATAWIFRTQLEQLVPGINDTAIAIAGAMALFLLPQTKNHPQEQLFTWEYVESLPWSVLILFGGGLSLAMAVQDTALAEAISQMLSGLTLFPVIVVMALLTALVLFLTELTSNTATAAAFLPIAGAIAIAVGVPAHQLAIPVALAASCAFMMPVATPPNAVVFGSGRIRIHQMVRAGIWLNALMLLLINALCLLLGDYIFKP